MRQLQLEIMQRHHQSQTQQQNNEHLIHTRQLLTMCDKLVWYFEEDGVVL